MVCPQCNYSNSPNVRFCDNCGFELVSSPATVSAAHNFQSASTPLPSSQYGRVEPAPSIANLPPTQVPNSNFTPIASQTASQRKVCGNCNYSAAPNATFCGYCQQLLPLSLQSSLNDSRWVIQSVLGQGGMGRAYAAYDWQTKETVVVKELLDEQGRPQHERKVYLDHFENEVTVLGSLSQIRSVPRLLHPVILEVPRYYFVMEYIDGTDLREMVKNSQQPFAVDKVVNYAIKVCEILEIIHGRNPPIVHRDIKPENLRLRTSDNSIVLLDFGIARNVRDGTKLSKVGTPFYVAPEQARGESAEPRTDLYSLAATLFYLLTTKEAPEIDINAVRQSGSIRKLNKAVPVELEELILVNLSEAPNERYSSATEFLYDLRQGKPTQMIKCDRCGMTNDRRLIYCTNCAAPLSSRSRQCPNNACNSFIPLRAKFCPSCGTRVAQTN